MRDPGPGGMLHKVGVLKNHRHILTSAIKYDREHSSHIGIISNALHQFPKSSGQKCSTAPESGVFSSAFYNKGAA